MEAIAGLAFYLGLGALAGLMAGLLGVGGGLVIVPALAWTLAGHGVSASVLMQVAVGTSLATIVVTSASSMYAHHRHAAVLWGAFRRLTPGIVVGALIGAAIADWLPSATLRLVFGCFVLVVAAQMGFGLRPTAHRTLPGAAGMAAAGGVIGMVSALVGIGGGSLTVPYLIWCNTSVRESVATSAACGLPIAVAGTAGFIAAGVGEAGLPAWSLGYVYGPALAGITLSSILLAPVGARLAHRLPAAALKRVFAVFLAVVGARMLWG